MGIFRFSFSAAGAIAAASCASIDVRPASRDAFSPLMAFGEDETPEDMRGAWRSRGYGWVFDIDRNGMMQYQIAGDSCFLTPDAAKGATDTLALEYDYYRKGPTKDQAILQLLSDDTEIRIDRLDRLPPACDAPTGSTRQETFDYFAALIAENYAFLERRGIDWPARVDAARARFSEDMSDRALFDLFAGMLDGFSDSHTKLIAEIDGERLRAQDGLGDTLGFIRARDMETPWLIGIFTAMSDDVLDPGARHVARDRILWGLIDNGRIGYVQVLQMGGFSGTPIGDPEFREAEFAAFDGIMDEALAAMAEADFVILDLSNNRGGYDAISRRLASRFAAAPFDAYATEVPGTGIARRMRRISPASGARFTGQVYLLTSDVTVSGGEIATLALRQLPNVTHVGGLTRGSFSTVLSKPLPNGWVVELSNEIVSAPDGVVYEESGIPPRVAIEVFPADDPIKGHRRAIERIIALTEQR
ncbi:MAG: hypothetical protein GC152_08305 [Alphaproteobacteria bacterium]|nr:hypothetical protein [Alphaproteobacteria bacterium]